MIQKQKVSSNHETVPSCGTQYYKSENRHRKERSKNSAKYRTQEKVNYFLYENAADQSMPSAKVAVVHRH